MTLALNSEHISLKAASFGLIIEVMIIKDKLTRGCKIIKNESWREKYCILIWFNAEVGIVHFYINI